MTKNKLRELRKATGKSQKDFYNEIVVTELNLGVTLRTYQNWEKPENEIKSKPANSLADYFNVSVSYLLGYSDKKEPYYSDEILIGDGQGGYTSLSSERENELNELKNVRRPQIIKALKDARAQGDLSENSDYDAARDAQGKVESRIKELEYRLEHSEIAKIEKGGKVSVGSTVTIDDDGDEDTYKIVGSAEADAFNNLISNVSPLGQALMSHKEGDIVTVESPNGQYSVKILKVC